MTRTVVCRDNRGLEASLVVGAVYTLIDDAAAEARGFYRLVDESGEDYLFYQEQFTGPDVMNRL